MFYLLNKLGLLALYAATAASFFVALPLPAEVVHWMRLIVGGLLVAHALEVVVFHRKVALYQGPMMVSVFLTVLFGFLHWLPLSKAQR
ncbi:MAG: hypothetical protein HYX44_14880 [Aquabacterium sp.]|nr:hypothetical protein [Aquabacterium sp.]